MTTKTSLKFAVLVASFALPAQALGDDPGPGPIHIIAEVHCDPMNNLPVALQEAVYNDWVAAVDTGLDDAEALGGRISYLSTGQFMEWVLERPVTGLPLMQRLHSSGGMIGTHMHSKWRASLFNWVPADTSTIPNIQAMWDDHIGLVDQVVNTALGIVDPADVRQANGSLGTHVPGDDALRLALLEANGFVGHQQGPCEEFFVYFEHYAMNPWRPSPDGMLRHDPDGPTVLVPFGPVLGENAIHFGILQDMRIPAMQGRFLLEILNWLDDLHVSHEGKVWVTGWGSHCHNLMEGEAAREAWIPAFTWFAENFVDTMVGGAVAATFSSITDSRNAYLEWEADNPGDVSFNYTPSETNWQEYPYLVPPAMYLVGSQLDETLPPIGDVRLHRLVGDAETDPHLVYVAYVAGAEGVTADLSSEFAAPFVALVNTRIGTWEVVPTDAVPVPVEGAIIVPAHRTRAITMYGDLNDDGRITGADLALVLAAWGGTGDADFNEDGIVNGGDLAVVLANWTA